MARNTDVMRAAQRQIDQILGGDRLPDHSDIDALPYIVAIAKETFRWAPPVPVGATHRLIEDDIYRGMFIPGGTIMVENIWWGGDYLVVTKSANVDCTRAIFNDETVYPDPHAYDPTRFLDKDGQIDSSVMAPESRIFGSGRR